jgi:spore maturation protein CgeB
VNVVFLGLSITSSWGNGHATNYRALVGELVARGHEVLFCERDVPWYAAHRDLPVPDAGSLCLYADLDELRRRAEAAVADADLVVLGSYVPEGVAVGDWALDVAPGRVAFYDIDTPVTLEKLAAGDEEYVSAEQLSRFDLYLSFTGGPTLDRLREEWGVRRPLFFPCLVDPRAYRPSPDVAVRYDLGYLGTYSADRQPTVQALLLDVARAEPGRRFVLGGPGYPDGPSLANLDRVDHVAPPQHPAFYAAQRFTLNVTRAQMRAAGFSPSVRLFEAAACGVPIISDRWEGLEVVLEPGREVLVADSAADVRELLGLDEPARRAIAARARRRVLAEHTAAPRVDVLEREAAAVRSREPGSVRAREPAA